jgi:hypothetical protein
MDRGSDQEATMNGPINSEMARLRIAELTREAEAERLLPRRTWWPPIDRRRRVWSVVAIAAAAARGVDPRTVRLHG